MAKLVLPPGGAELNRTQSSYCTNKAYSNFAARLNFPQRRNREHVTFLNVIFFIDMNTSGTRNRVYKALWLDEVSQCLYQLLVNPVLRKR